MQDLECGWIGWPKLNFLGNPRGELMKQVQTKKTAVKVAKQKPKIARVNFSVMYSGKIL
jgi:hypothetical protein